MTVSNTFKSAFYGQHTDALPLMRIDIDHADLPSPLRYVNNTENVTSGGNVYLAAGFEARLPDKKGKARIRICNVNRAVVQAIRSITGKPTITLAVILHADPDTIEHGPFVMTLSDVGWTAITVDGYLSFDDFLDEPCPGDTFTPGTYPGLI